MLRFQVRQEVVHCANVIAPFWQGPFTEVGEARSFTLAGSDAFNLPARWTHLPTGKTEARGLMWRNYVMRIVFCLTPMRTPSNSDMRQGAPYVGHLQVDERAQHGVTRL
jgi:hypothetical protein